MRITKSNPRSRVAFKSEWWLWSFLLVLAFGLGLLVCQLGWGDLLRAYVDVLRRAPQLIVMGWSQRVEVPSLTLDLAFADYQRLYARREQAPNPAIDVTPVPAMITSKEGAVSVDLRLLNVAVTESNGVHWPFELIANAGESLLGMRSAILVPADEDLLFTQRYLAMLHDLGSPVPMRRYVRLTVNGTDWGLYVLEELPSTEMLVAEGFSPESVVVFFDPHEYLEAQPVVLGDSFAYAQIAVVRAVGGSREEWAAALDGDPALAAVYADVVRTLRGVELGEYAPSEAFDVETLARYLAAMMFWRGSSVLDWRTLYLAYDPATRRFVPIGTNAVADSTTQLPTAFIDDPAIQYAYVQTLRTFCKPEFLEAMQEAWDLESSRLSAFITLGYPLADWDALSAHQDRIQSMLSPSRTLFARVTEIDGILQVRLDAVLPFPVEVLGFDFAERGFLPAAPTWVNPQTKAAFVTGVDGVILRARVSDAPVMAEMQIPLSSLPMALQGVPDEIRIVTRIWGLDAQIVVPAEWGNE